MAKDKKDKPAKRIPKRIGNVKLPKELRRRGEALLDRAATPEGRQAIAGALTLAATAAAGAVARAAETRAAARTPVTGDPAADGAARPDPLADMLGTAAGAVLGLLAARKG